MEAALRIFLDANILFSAAIACKCDVLMTGDRTHFGPGYGHAFDGVTVHSPAQLALAVWGAQRGQP